MNQPLFRREKSIRKLALKAYGGDLEREFSWSDLSPQSSGGSTTRSRCSLDYKRLEEASKSDLDIYLI